MKTLIISTDHYLPFIDEIEKQFKNSDVLIHDARNQIKLIDYAGEKLVVKSFKVPHLLNRIVYSFFRDSKAKRSYLFAQKISAYTPEAIAYVEYRASGLLSRSYFVAKHLDFDFDIRRPLLEMDFPERERVFKQFAVFVYQLHQQGIIHLDLSPGNILIKQMGGGEYQFKIVDINRMKFKSLSKHEKAKNFSKLWANNADLTIMLSEYAALSDLDISSFVQQGLHENQRNKNIKNFKKCLKGQQVND